MFERLERGAVADEGSPSRCSQGLVETGDRKSPVVLACQAVLDSHSRCLSHEERVLDASVDHDAEALETQRALRLKRVSARARGEKLKAHDAGDLKAKHHLLFTLRDSFGRTSPDIGLLALSITEETYDLLLDPIQPLHEDPGAESPLRGETRPNWLPKLAWLMGTSN